jgi:hypothetical protein
MVTNCRKTVGSSFCKKAELQDYPVEVSLATKRRSALEPLGSMMTRPQIEGHNQSVLRIVTFSDVTSEPEGQDDSICPAPAVSLAFERPECRTPRMEQTSKKECGASTGIATIGHGICEKSL